MFVMALCRCQPQQRVLSIWTTFLLLQILPRGVQGSDHPSCNETLPKDVSEGVIFSPNFPYSYWNELYCNYQFVFPSSLISSTGVNRFCLTFHRFSIEHHKSCNYDSLRIGYNGPKLCGNNSNGELGLTVYPSSYNLSTWPTICYETTAINVDVVFRTDSSEISSGFYATYTINQVSNSIGNEPCPSCGQMNCAFGQKVDKKGCQLCECKDFKTAPCDVDELVCFNSSRCIPNYKACDGQSDCNDGSDEIYELTKCGGSGCEPSCVSLGCTFEDTMCGYTTDDDNSWKLITPSTLSSISGPSSDHTCMCSLHSEDSGYVYFDASYITSPLLGDLFLGTIRVHRHKPKCLQFWYSIHGQQDVRLEVDIQSGTSASLWIPVWLASGNDLDMWQLGQIDLKYDGLYQWEDFKVSFRGVRGRNDILRVAIDDVSVLNGECIRRDFSCTFENGSCGWLLGDNIHIQYGSAYGITGKVALAVVSPHSLLNSGQASMRTEYIVHNVRAKKCFMFKYFKSVHTKITVDYQEDNGYQHEMVQLSRLSNNWFVHTVEFKPIYSAYRIVLTVWPYGDFGELPNASAVFDYVQLRDGPCVTPLTTVSPCFGWDQFLCANGRCHRQTDRCDGYNDCGDYSDEENCTGVDTHCYMFKFRCANGRCIYQHLTCNGNDDCGDNSDEEIGTAGCANKSPVGGMIGIIFGVICVLILMCIILILTCKYVKKRRHLRNVNQHRHTRPRHRSAPRVPSPCAISHTGVNMLPPPYSAVVNHGFLSDSFPDLPPSYDSVIAMSQTNPAVITYPLLPPYSAYPGADNLNIPTGDCGNNNSNSTQMQPVAGDVGMRASTNETPAAGTELGREHTPDDREVQTVAPSMQSTPSTVPDIVISARDSSHKPSDDPVSS